MADKAISQARRMLLQDPEGTLAVLLSGAPETTLNQVRRWVSKNLKARERVPAVHFDPSGGFLDPACGVYGALPNCSADPDKVTCGSCEKTTVWRDFEAGNQINYPIHVAKLEYTGSLVTRCGRRSPKASQTATSKRPATCKRCLRAVNWQYGE